jgi:hypothetical protein
MSGSELAAMLESVRSRIARTAARGLNEQNTKATLIEPVLRALGWNTEDVDEVVHEYTSGKRGNPVDYGLLIERQPRLLLEAKPYGATLSDAKWATQFLGYALVAGVTWMVLTNGDEYRIYNTHARVPLEEKLWRTVRVSNGGPAVEETLSLLARDRLGENRIDRLWQAHFVDQKVKVALEELLSVGTDARLLRLIRDRASDLSPSDIRASLRRCRATLDFPVPPATVRGPARRGRASRQKTPEQGATDLRALVKSGVLRPPVQLTRVYKGRTLTATIEPDASVTCLGRRFASPSMAASAARASIIGSAPGGRPPATNGWDFWRVVSGEGRSTPLTSFRDRASPPSEAP